LSEFVAAHMGLHFPPERWADLRKGMESASVEFGFDDPNACAEWLMSSPLDKAQIEVLASDLTVGETYFFRERKSFEVLEREVLPALISDRRGGSRRLKIWSAGCCTGEEAYSLAVLLDRLIPDRADWDIRLLATDINPRFLRAGAEGVFGEWSFRDAPPGLKDKYFIPMLDGRYQIRPEIRQMVRFEYLNLAGDRFPSLLNNTNALDLILCRNVLIYMGPQQIKAMVEKFARALMEDGWLAVGAAEISHVSSAELATVNFAGTTVYRKCEHAHHLPPLTLPIQRESLRPLPNEKAATDAWACLRADEPPMEVSPAPASVPDPLPGAVILYEQGQYAETIELLLPLASQEQPPVAALAMLARACANKGDLVGALSWSHRAIEGDRLNARLHYLCGMIKQELADPAASAASFRRALYLDPEFIMAHFAMGHLAFQRGGIREGTRNFDNALRLLRNCPVDGLVPESEGMSSERLAEIISHLKGTNLAQSEVP
jgi:chemotaxis protein methyltransferase CheR